MKKLLIPACMLMLTAISFTATSCNDKVCIKCTKIGDASTTKELCSSDQDERNNFIVEWTHADYNCVNE